MDHIDLQKEWDFVSSETTHLSESNKAVLTKELLFTAQSLLTLYCREGNVTQKSFLASIYIKTKDEYLKET